jgi:hypothetical protein
MHLLQCADYATGVAEKAHLITPCFYCIFRQNAFGVCLKCHTCLMFWHAFGRRRQAGRPPTPCFHSIKNILIKNLRLGMRPALNNIKLFIHSFFDCACR